MGEAMRVEKVEWVDSDNREEPCLAVRIDDLTAGTEVVILTMEEWESLMAEALQRWGLDACSYVEDLTAEAEEEEREHDKCPLCGKRLYFSHGASAFGVGIPKTMCISYPTCPYLEDHSTPEGQEKRRLRLEKVETE